MKRRRFHSSSTQFGVSTLFPGGVDFITVTYYFTGTSVRSSQPLYFSYDQERYRQPLVGRSVVSEILNQSNRSKLKPFSHHKSDSRFFVLGGTGMKRRRFIHHPHNFFPARLSLPAYSRHITPALYNLSTFVQHRTVYSSRQPRTPPPPGNERLPILLHPLGTIEYGLFTQVFPT